MWAQGSVFSEWIINRGRSSDLNVCDSFNANLKDKVYRSNTLGGDLTHPNPKYYSRNHIWFSACLKNTVTVKCAHMFEYITSSSYSNIIVNKVVSMKVGEPPLAHLGACCDLTDYSLHADCQLRKCWICCSVYELYGTVWVAEDNWND
jgi:hypothetical protein